jgi:hypothetical protein
VGVIDNVRLALLLFVAACAPRAQPSKTPEAPWGNEVGGLRCRVRAPSVAAQGDLLRASVDIGLIRREEHGIEFDPNLRTRGTSLELVGHDGRAVVVRTYDPYCAMPMILDPAEAPPRLRDPDESLMETLEFPLAMAWDELAPGDYRCRVRLSYQPEREGCFRGTLVSPEFPLRVDQKPSSEETYLLPRTLRVVETTRDDGNGNRIPVRQVTYGKGDAEEVRLPRRNGFFLGTRLYRDGALFGEGGGVEPDATNPIDESFGTSPGDQKLGASYTIVIFETADAPEHMWGPGPGSGGYRELWRRTIAMSGAENILEK